LAEYAALERAREASLEARRLEARRLAWTRYELYSHDAEFRREAELDARLLAQLRRARELAVAEGRTDAVARVDRLIARERARHYGWIAVRYGL